ncbi:uncharacterized protein LOC129719957, partial [Wyeomyia smithii]|uniref:uncharacterized protein LOC129719957 n=1 Tax=Wyeomyia smithii TaxID=174621 RepID=UPI002467EA90
FPVLSAFNGLLISMDFKYLQPSAINLKNIVRGWTSLVPLMYDLNFVRALSIVRLKNPSRGSKMYRSNDTARKNPLYRIVEWVEEKLC